MTNIFSELRLEDGSDLASLSHSQKLLFLLVRHSGCTFCRESLSQLSEYKKDLQAKGVRLFIVHMGEPDTSAKLAKEYDLEDATFVSDPERRFYRAFGARRAKFSELLGPRVWKEAFKRGSLGKHGIGKIDGDASQLGGIYLMDQGKARRMHDPCDASDIGDWSKVLKNL